MWPFKKKVKPIVQTVSPNQIRYSQLDITETFGDDARLQPEDWVPTLPLNKMTSGGQESGLPRVDAGSEEVYAVAAKMSRVRESFAVPNDGVYCPVCHLANMQAAKLHTPCPQCGRALLKFGWD